MTTNPAEVAHGPMLIGTFLNVLLYGVCVVQVYLYHNSHRRDKIGVQAFIYLLFLADTLHTIFTAVYMYRSLVKDFGNFESLATADWIAATDPALTGIIGGSVQIFYVWRVKILTRNWFLVVAILFCACSSLLMGVGAAAAVHWVPVYTDFQKFKPVTIIWLVSAAVGDVLITTGLVRYLKQQRSGFEKTNSYLDRIMRLTIQTGLLTAVWAIADLVLYLSLPSGLHLIFNFSLSKLYSNSLMSSLNARDFWKYDSTTTESRMHESMSNGAGTTAGGNLTQLTTLRDQNRQHTEVFVHVERTNGLTDTSKVDFADAHDDREGYDSKAQAFNSV